MEVRHICIITKNMMSGGAERVISHLLSYCEAKKNLILTLILIDDKPRHYSIPLSVNIITIGKKSDNPVIDKFKRYSTVRKLIIKLSPDIVLSMPEEIGIYAILSIVGTKIPVVVSERNDPRVMPNKTVTRILRYISYIFASGFIFQTNHAASFFSKRIQEKGIVIPNPLDEKRLPIPYSGIRKKIIVGAGRLNQQKNFSLLISAFAVFFNKGHRDYRLIIYGEGPCRDKLLNDVTKYGLPPEAVELPGRVENFPDRVNGASIFVLSSDFEGMPNVLIEAMACGVPSISTDCPAGGSKYLITQGINGILVPIRDRNGLVDAMLEIVNNPEFSACLSGESVKIRERLNSEIICSKWLEYLEGIVKKRSYCRE